jgi:Fe-S-cluster containining protein
MLIQVEENIAKIVVNPKTKQIAEITFYKRNFQFKCKRCATLCCKLGSPNLTEKDVQRIKEAGYAVDNFLEPTTRLGKRDDGSCIFLRFDDNLKIYECSIYDVRPVLCRIYPFDFERIDSNSFMLKFIPCCRGLNSPDGELVDEKFVNNCLLDAILEIL